MVSEGIFDSKIITAPCNSMLKIANTLKNLLFLANVFEKNGNNSGGKTIEIV